MRLYEDRAKDYESNDAGQEVAYSKGARKREMARKPGNIC